MQKYVCHLVFQKCTETLDNLREVKCILEGSEVKVTAPEIDEALLQELRQLTLMHIPTSVTDDVRKTFKNLIFKCFEGICSYFDFLNYLN